MTQHYLKVTYWEFSPHTTHLQKEKKDNISSMLCPLINEFKTDLSSLKLTPNYNRKL